jgi:hypothetical protein
LLEYQHLVLLRDICGLYYKLTTIVNYASSVVSEQSFQLIDDARVIIYDHHVFIVQAAGGQISNFFMLFMFSTLELIRHLWQLKTVVFLHWCLICAFLLNQSCKVGNWIIIDFFIFWYQFQIMRPKFTKFERGQKATKIFWNYINESKILRNLTKVVEFIVY